MYYTVLINSTANVLQGGFISWTSKNFNFIQPKFLLGYSINAYFNSTTAGLKDDDIDTRSTILIYNPPPQSFSLETASISANTVIQQNQDVNAQRIILNYGQFQISPVELSTWSLQITCINRNAVAGRITSQISLWIEDDMKAI